MNFDGIYKSLSVDEVDSYGIDNGLEYEDGVGFKTRNFAVVSKDRANLSPTFSISLRDIFPFMKAGNQLPLFMFGNDRIQLELYFKPASELERLSVKGDNSGEFNINRNSVMFISDHIFYPTLMDNYAQQNKELTFSFFDYQLSTRSLVAKREADGTAHADQNITQNTRNIGGAGRLATRVFSAVSEDLVEPHKTLLNGYSATAPLRVGDFNDTLSTQIFYNERFLYPLRVSNMARHYHNLKDAQQKLPYATRDTYGNEGNALNNVAGYGFEGRLQSDNLAGQQLWTGFRLNRGERVGSKGVELTMDISNLVIADGDKKYTQYSYLEVLKYATLKDGQIEVFFA
jgi:hypothetical protein